MATDLTDIQSAQTVKIAGASAAGVEDNFAEVDASGNLQVKNNNGAGASAVNIQDGGNSITVDGVFFQATQPVSVASLPLPTGAATSANQSTQTTSLQLIDDLPHVQNDALVKGVPVMGQLDDTSTTLATEDAVAVARITAQRAIHTNLRNNAGTEVGTSSNPVRTDPTGTTAQPVTITGGSVTSVTGYGTLAAYSACSTAFVSTASATDVFTIRGSATKIVRVSLITISGTTTAGSGFSINETLVKRSTANTGGTFVTATSVPHDSADSATTTVVGHYTANPTALGTAAGTLRGIRQTIATAGVVNNITTWDFGIRPAKPIVLRGVTEMLAVNFNGASITGPIITIYVEYTEE